MGAVGELGNDAMKELAAVLDAARDDAAQRDLLFDVLRYRETFPGRTGKKFYCCPKCTAKLHECVSARVFRYIDNVKWQAEIEEEAQ